MRTLTFSSLFPNSAQPRHGIFVERRLQKLLHSQEVMTTVVAPVPWFPFSAAYFGSYGVFAKVPRIESRDGLQILHPRYPLIPKLGMTFTPLLMALFMWPVLKRQIKSGNNFDVIDAHYFYPDGVAAAMLGKWLNKPVCITARGTDINYIPRYRWPRKQILWAANNCSAIITVCQALKDSVVSMGIAENRVTVLRNGVDLDLFKPMDRNAVKKDLGIEGTTLLSVGHLIERKGHNFAIEALQKLADVSLIIAGDGELEHELKKLAADLGVSKRVRFVGALSQDKLVCYYNAVDALVLASSREGMANVLLESIACGNPVIANPCWGTPEIIATPESGVLMEDRSSDAIVKGLRQLLQNYPDRMKTREYALNFSWDDTTKGQIELFNHVTNSAVNKQTPII